MTLARPLPRGWLRAQADICSLRVPPHTCFSSGFGSRAFWNPAPTAPRRPGCPPAPHPLTGVGLQQHLSLPQDPLCPVLGAVCPSQEVFKVSIKLGLLRLAEFLLCELGRKQQGRSRGQAFGGWPIAPHPGAWLLLSRMRGLVESEPWILEAP